jgi:nucleoside-triphosphatase THEP1
MHDMGRIWRVSAAILFAIMALTGRQPAIIAGAAGALAFTLLVDQSMLRRMGRWKFWLVTVTVTLLAGMLLGENPKPYHGIPLSTDGLVAGLMMNLRAFTLIASTVLLARSVSREHVLAASSRWGVRHIQSAFEQAMETLPSVDRTWKMLRRDSDSQAIDTLAMLLVRMADLAEGWPNGRVYGVTGARGVGKTTLLSDLAKIAEKNGLKVGGIRQKRVLGEDGATLAYDVCRWPETDKLRIAEGTPGRGFKFSEQAFVTAASWMEQDSGEADLLVVDELGLLESRGEGHAPAVRTALRQSRDLLIVAALRKDRIDSLSELFGIREENLIDLDHEEADREKFVKLVLDAVQEAKEKSPKTEASS